MRACHVAMRDALRSTPGDYPIGMPLSMHEYEALPGGEELVDSFRREMEDEYLRSVGDDDFIGVQCYTKLVFGPDGLIAHPEGELTEMGYLFWPSAWSTPSVELPQWSTSDHHDRERDRHR